MSEFQQWRHVFKLDPNKTITDEALEAVCDSGTDAVVVGGSDGVTLDHTLDLLARIRRYSVSCALEVSNFASITPGFDYYLIPSILNSGHTDWVIGHHQQAAKSLADVMDWHHVIGEGYCVLNEAAKVAQLTEADTNLSEEDICAYALLAEHLFHMPIFYLEYSGRYGGPDIVKKVSQTLDHTRLFYGGGITNREQAEEMAQWADTIVVGNAIYEDLRKALKTVKAVKKQ